MQLINEHVERRPVTAVIYTHSHADHFGGVLGVTSRAEVDAGKCRIIAPEHFMRETIGENVIAGPAMARRATYQFGPLLPPGLRDRPAPTASDVELLSLEPIQRLVAILRQLPGFEPQLLLKRLPRLMQETELRRMGADLARGLAERGVVRLVRDVLVGGRVAGAA